MKDIVDCCCLLDGWGFGLYIYIYLCTCSSIVPVSSNSQIMIYATGGSDKLLSFFPTLTPTRYERRNLPFILKLISPPPVDL